MVSREDNTDNSIINAISDSVSLPLNLNIRQQRRNCSLNVEFDGAMNLKKVYQTFGVDSNIQNAHFENEQHDYDPLNEMQPTAFLVQH